MDRDKLVHRFPERKRAKKVPNLRWAALARALGATRASAAMADPNGPPSANRSLGAFLAFASPTAELVQKPPLILPNFG